VASNIAGDLTAAGGVTDVNRILEAEVLDDSGRVGSVVVHVVPVAHLGGATVAASVMRDDSIPVSQEEKHLGVPVVGGEWPAVVEDDRLRSFGTPVLIEDFDAVFGCYEAHVRGPSFEGCYGKTMFSA
jgi:hypothetical protein